jgi:hypothetical protein
MLKFPTSTKAISPALHQQVDATSYREHPRRHPYFRQSLRGSRGVARQGRPVADILATRLPIAGASAFKKIDEQVDYIVFRDSVVLPPANRGQGRRKNQIAELKSDLPAADPGGYLKMSI